MQLSHYAVNWKRFKDALTNFIVATDQPFNLVEQPPFQELIQMISKDTSVTDLPSRTTMTTIIQQKFLQVKTELILKLQKEPAKCSVVIDGWTSSNQHAFQGVILRYGDRNWNLVTVPLD